MAPRRYGVVLIALVAALASTACGVGVRHLNAQSAAAQIASELSREYPVPPPPVTCPKGVPAQAGRTFTCSTVLDGQPLQVTGTVIDGQGRFTAATDVAIVVTSRAEAELDAKLRAAEHLPAKVSCGPRSVLVVRVGGTFTCTVVLGNEAPRVLTVTVGDLHGDVTFTLGPKLNP